MSFSAQRGDTISNKPIKVIAITLKITHPILHVSTETINPLQPNITMHILHTVIYPFPKVLTRRICLTIKNFFG